MDDSVSTTVFGSFVASRFAVAVALKTGRDVFSFCPRCCACREKDDRQQSIENFRLAVVERLAIFTKIKR